MSLLSLVSRFAAEVNIESNVTTVMGTTDPQIIQMKALLQKEVNDLAGRGDWEALVNEAVHTTIAQEDQGAITTIASNNFRYVKNNTIWNRSSNLPIYIVSAADWQQSKATAATSPNYEARIRGGKLIVDPIPSAGETWAFEYVTWNAITDSTGETQKQYFTNDADLMLLPELLLEAGLEWRWKKQKGMEYAEDFRTYEMLVANELSRNGLKRPLSLDQCPHPAKPGIGIPDGNWNL